ncbi:MAG: outer membrane beta-barrel protein [Crocinitomicaceae bacterium]|nr:outer membrane beta-barrel protein [Crocinitomicaceae bacterium]
MKRTIFAAVAAFGMIFGAQTNATAQVEEGTFIIDPYVGAPTANVWWKSFENETDFRAVGGPVGYGGRLEYMVADNFGVGLDVNFAKTGYEYTCEQCGDWDTTTQMYTDETIGYEANKLRIMIRLNYHFVQTEAVDVYTGVGVGYKYVKRTAYIDGDVDASYSYPSLIPVAFRAALGMRYYFIPMLGLHLELGIGGGQIMEAGISVKI